MLNGRAIWCLDHGRPIAAQACTRVPGRYVSRLFFIMTLSFTAVVAADASRDLRAQAPKETIVGPGAATCQRVNDDIESNPLLRRDYLAWVQGFMSGILSSRPPGVDEGLNLAPMTFAGYGIERCHFCRLSVAYSRALKLWSLIGTGGPGP